MGVCKYNNVPLLTPSGTDAGTNFISVDSNSATTYLSANSYRSSNYIYTTITTIPSVTGTIYYYLYNTNGEVGSVASKSVSGSGTLSYNLF